MDESEPAEKPPSNCSLCIKIVRFSELSERKEEVDRDDRSQSGNQAESALLPAARLQFEMVSFSAVLFIFSLVTYTSPLYFVIMI